MMSAPIPSARVRQSDKAPVVKPTIRRTRNTCRESASTLNAERSGWTPRLLHRRSQTTNPLYGFMSIANSHETNSGALILHPLYKQSKARRDFNSCVENFVEKDHRRIPTARETNSLILFAQR